MKLGTGTAIVVIGLVYCLAVAVIAMSVSAIRPVVAPLGASPMAIVSPESTSRATPSAATSATPRPTLPSATPRPTVRPTSPPVLVTGISGTASFYCLLGVSPCTIGHLGGLYAAAGPELRAKLGDWRRRKVTVWRGDAHVTVTLIDFCACPDAAIDLYADAFVLLGPLSQGILDVIIRWEAP